jgi:hypothetical protein
LSVYFIEKIALLREFWTCLAWRKAFQSTLRTKNSSPEESLEFFYSLNARIDRRGANPHKQRVIKQHEKNAFAASGRMTCSAARLRTRANQTFINQAA